MIKEYDSDHNVVATYGDDFSAEQVEAFYAEFGKDATNTFLDHLNLYGEAHLRPLDPSEDDNGHLFIDHKDE